MYRDCTHVVPYISIQIYKREVKGIRVSVCYVVYCVHCTEASCCCIINAQ
jgi:hypothetical protein